MRFRNYVRNTLDNLNHSSRLLRSRVHFDPQPKVVEFEEDAEYEPSLEWGRRATITF